MPARAVANKLCTYQIILIHRTLGALLDLVEWGIFLFIADFLVTQL